MKIIAITQARIGSSRLPAKILKKIGNSTLLDIHLKRILQSKLISKLIVATTIEEGSEQIVQIAKKYGIETYKGSVENVLDRFYNSVKTEAPDYVVRLTSDCPLIDHRVIDMIIKTCISSEYDYVSNTLLPTFPDGVDVEVFRFSALEKAFKEAKLKSDKEHVTPYIWRNSTVKGGKIFKSYNFTNATDCSSYRITVDTFEDFIVISKLVEVLGENKKWEDYINYLNHHPEIKEINNFHVRNEGYTKSLIND